MLHYAYFYARRHKQLFFRLLLLEFIPPKNIKRRIKTGLFKWRWVAVAIKPNVYLNRWTEFLGTLKTGRTSIYWTKNNSVPLQFRMPNQLVLVCAIIKDFPSQSFIVLDVYVKGAKVLLNVSNESYILSDLTEA